MLLAHRRERGSKRQIGRHAATNRESSQPRFSQRLLALQREYLDDRRLKARGEIGSFRTRWRRNRLRHILTVAGVQHRSLQPAEAELEPCVVVEGTGEAMRPWIPLCGFLLHGGTAGEAEPEDRGDLVERFAGGVVAGAAEQFQGQRGVALEERSMPPADDEPHAREDVAPGGQATRENVAGHVVHADERHAERQAQHLRRGDADQERPDQPRRVVNGHATDLAQGNARPRKCFVDRWKDAPQVRPGGDLGNDSAEPGVQARLRSDDARTDFECIREHGRRRLIAAGFNREEVHEVMLAKHVPRRQFDATELLEVIAKLPDPDASRQPRHEAQTLGSMKVRLFGLARRAVLHNGDASEPDFVADLRGLQRLAIRFINGNEAEIVEVPVRHGPDRVGCREDRGFDLEPIQLLRRSVVFGFELFR